jgi:predicted PurR-regulated permease PerM
MGLLMTMAIGVASVVIAGLLVGGFLGFIVAIVVGVCLVAVWSHLMERGKPGWRRALRI